MAPDASTDGFMMPELLHPADTAAVDALVEAGLDIRRVGSQHAERSAGVLQLLDQLNTPVMGANRAAGAPLIQQTLERIERADAALRAERDSVESLQAGQDLAPMEEEALESLIANHFDPRRVPGALRVQAEQQLNLLQLLDGEAVSVDDHSRQRLISGTLDRVQMAIDTQERAMLLPGSDMTAGRRFGLSNLVSVAALLLIGLAVMFPVLSNMRDKAREAVCGANLAGIGRAFGTYATDHKDSLPLASAAVPGSPWWFVGDPNRSNSANVFLLPGRGYARMEDFACPGNTQACAQMTPGARDWASLGQVSYSFQNLFARQRPRWQQDAGLVVLVDRSPVILRAVAGRVIDPEENSPNHHGRGQHMLLMNGSVVWTTSPFVPGRADNVWLPRSVEKAIRQLKEPRRAEPLRGTEEPTAIDDVFVGP